MKPDLIIRNGIIVDGTGAPPFEGDVAVAGDRIIEVGRVTGSAGSEVDARGKIVTPGFIDVHTHLDAQVSWDPLCSPSNVHGVTSVVVGNCGVGFAPCKPADRDYLIFLMEGVEDVPGAALRAGMSWHWETFPQYLDHIAALPLALNVGAHISHAPLRIYAMGERGATDAQPTEEELRGMRTAVAEAMRAGALGFASGRTTMHRTPAWDPVPGTFAGRRELEALAGGLVDAGAGVFELVPYGAAGEDANGYLRDHEWLVPVARDYRRPFSVTLIQSLAYRDRWRDFLELMDDARANGAQLVPQVAARSVGVLLGFGIALSPLSLFPAAGDLFGKPVADVRVALRDPALRARLVESMDGSGEILGGMARIEHIFPLDDVGVRAYENSPDRSIVAIGKRLGKHPGEVMLDLLVQHDCRNFFLVPLYNCDLDAAGEMLSHPASTIGLGDAGAHTSQTSDAGFPTFILGYWVRERKLLRIEQAVRKLTGDLAAMWAIKDRGVLQAGAFADINIIDLDKIYLHLPEVRHELPTGAPHLYQGASGYAATIVNGQVVMRDGTHTGALPGRLIRNAQYDA
jgi:N-acyl-D-aspartate/D-glutamate deacylase